MPRPIITQNAGIYSLAWLDYNLVMRLDRLREKSDVVSAEITIKSSLPGQPSHIHQARLNLVSTTARKQLATFLTTRYGDVPPWGDLLEQTCVMVLARHREGEPPIRLGDLPKREALKYCAQPLLVENQANMWYGAGQTGKSMLACYIAVLVETPVNHNGIEVEPGKVLYVDYETDETEVGERVRAIQGGLDLETPTDILYRYGKMPLADDIEQIQRITIENGIELVIVDSLGMAAGGDQDKSTDIIRYFQALRTLKCTTLTIDHLNKEGKLYGNVYKFNEGRNIWEVKGVADAGEARLDIGLYHRKMNNGRLLNPLGFSFKFGERAYTVKKQDIRTIPDLEVAMPLVGRLRTALSRGAMTIAEVSEELSVPGKKTTEAYIRTTLNRHKGIFEPVYVDGQRENKWGLKASVSNDTYH